MADISVLSRLVAGTLRNVDLSSNTIVVSSVKIGASALEIKETAGHFDFSAKNLTNVGTVDGRNVSADGAALEAHLDGGASKHDATEVDYERADGSKKNIQAASDDVEAALSDLDDAIGALDQTPTNYTAANPAIVADHLAGIDAQLAAVVAGDKYVKISANDTTAGYLDAKVTAGAGLSKTIANPSANEALDLAVNVDDSTIEISSDALRVKDAGITDAKIAAGVDAAKIADGSVSNTEFQYLNGVTSAIQTQLDAKVEKAGSSMDSGANITFSGGGEVLGLPSTPSAASAAASKAYVDAVALGLAPKKAVLAASTGPVTLSSQQTVDGVIIYGGQRVLIKDQANPAENGIYISAAGAWTRATDFDSLSPIDEINGAWVPVQSGTQAGKIFVQYGVVSTLDTDPVTFEFYNPIAALIGGDMVTVTGSTITLDLSATSGLESSNAGDPAGQLRIKLEASNPSLMITGSNELAAKLDAAGAITSGASGLKVEADDSSIEISANELRIKALGVTNAMLAGSIEDSKLNQITTANKVAGSAVQLATDSGLEDSSGLKIKPDTTTADTLAISLTANGAGVKYDSNSFTESAEALALAANVAGAGLALASGALSVNVDDSSIEINADALRVKTTAYDQSTITGGSGTAAAVAKAPKVSRKFIAGQAFSANTTYAVRLSVFGETPERLFAAQRDASVANKYLAIGMIRSGVAVNAGDEVEVVLHGELVTWAGNWGAEEVGKEIFVGDAGAVILGASLANTAGEAAYCIGVVADVGKIWVDFKQLRGIA